MKTRLQFFLKHLGMTCSEKSVSPDKFLVRVRRNRDADLNASRQDGETECRHNVWLSLLLLEDVSPRETSRHDKEEKVIPGKRIRTK